ncbi:MAG: ribonuclease III [Parcubacteria group bacterium RIFCSPHIGHO2_01_FULL_47_10b]|nr:MAG: ribonuclease III [Parcubacteria group bacterium RIFCSPHIGHO2_01_FULL_47_10b]
MKHCKAVEQKLGIAFHNPSLIEQALVHKSYAAENPAWAHKHNERLEFLGDAVLELVVSEHLYRTHTESPEGDLTNWKSILVNTKMLSMVASDLGISEHISLSRGERISEGAKKESILANTTEAIIGALYLDQGYEAARDLVTRIIISREKEMLSRAPDYNPKGRFQEEAQRRVAVTPTYRVLEESGPDHNRHFVVGAYIGDRFIAQGTGSSKQEGEAAAAREALRVEGWNGV